MDPQACWKRLCDSLAAGDVEDAIYASDDLVRWLRRGGYRPGGVPSMTELCDFRHTLNAVLTTVNGVPSEADIGGEG